jgi:hypothetical protein
LRGRQPAFNPSFHWKSRVEVRRYRCNPALLACNGFVAAATEAAGLRAPSVKSPRFRDQHSTKRGESGDGFVPVSLPVTRHYLNHEGVSDKFVAYLKSFWPNLMSAWSRPWRYGSPSNATRRPNRLCSRCSSVFPRGPDSGRATQQRNCETRTDEEHHRPAPATTVARIVRIEISG